MFVNECLTKLLVLKTASLLIPKTLIMETIPNFFETIPLLYTAEVVIIPIVYSLAVTTE
jgi:hypothetical protein